MKYLLIFVIISVNLLTGETLSCYSCEMCNDPFNKTVSIERPCFTVRPMHISACMKITATFFNGQTMVWSRDCTAILPSSGRNVLPNGTDDEFNEFNVKSINTDYCYTDYCNGSPLLYSSLLLITSISLLVLK